jgi:hypothetical protein
VGKLKVGVAVYAWDGCPAGYILINEVADDVGIECTLIIYYVMRYAESGGGAPGIDKVVDCAARSELSIALPLVIQLHRQPNDLMACIGQ